MASCDFLVVEGIFNMMHVTHNPILHIPNNSTTWCDVSSIHCSYATLESRLQKQQQSPVKSVRRALVPTRVLEQILLVIVLGIIPGPRCLYSRGNFLFFGSKMLLLHFLRHSTGNHLLLWGMEEYSGAVLCMMSHTSALVTWMGVKRTGAAICALRVERCRVMCSIEILCK